MAKRKICNFYEMSFEFYSLKDKALGALSKFLDIRNAFCSNFLQLSDITWDIRNICGYQSILVRGMRSDAVDWILFIFVSIKMYVRSCLIGWMNYECVLECQINIVLSRSMNLLILSHGPIDSDNKTNSQCVYDDDDDAMRSGSSWTAEVVWNMCK